MVVAVLFLAPLAVLVLAVSGETTAALILFAAILGVYRFAQFVLRTVIEIVVVAISTIARVI